MHTVEIIRATVAAGRRVSIGDIIEVTDADAKTLIALGKAAPVVEAPVADHKEKDQKTKISKREAKKEDE